MSQKSSSEISGFFVFTMHPLTEALNENITLIRQFDYHFLNLA